MANEWASMVFTDAVQVNPSVPLRKGMEYPFVEMQAVEPSWRDVSESERRVFTSGGARFMSGDTLMARITPCLENGKIARYSPRCGGNEPAFGSTEFIVIRGRDGVTDNDYAYYLTKWQEFRQFAVSQMTGSSGRQRVPASALENFLVPVPPLSEQRAIAHVLGTLDDKIECNRRLNRTLEGIVRALFKSWFIDFDPVIDNALAAGNPIPDDLADRAALRQQAAEEHAKPLPDDLRALFPAEFTHTDTMGWIPKGWTPSSVSAVIMVNPSVRLAKNTVAPFIDMKALPTDSLTVMEVAEKAYAGGAKFQNGDVLLARITPCLENGKTALVDFLDGAQVGFGSTEFIVLRRTKRTCQEYVYSLARSDAFRTHCIASMVGSSGRQRVQTACLDTFHVAVPPEPVMATFRSRSRPLVTRITANATAMRITCRLRDTLLPKLLTGEVTVPVAATLTEETGQ